tara:strand:+ start:2465 stop:2830 length:366 start_codon:yes stop_codon:yes gene_type:complete
MIAQQAPTISAKAIADNGNGMYESHLLLKKIEKHFNISSSSNTIALTPPGTCSLYTGYLYYLTYTCESVGICVPESCREQVERIGLTLPVYYGYNTDPVHIVSPEEEDRVISCMDLAGKLA